MPLLAWHFHAAWRLPFNEDQRRGVCRFVGGAGDPVSAGRNRLRYVSRQIEFQIAAGTNCLCPVGTTGESPTLSHEEQDRVIAFVVEAVAGRIKVMPGTGSNSTAEALRLTKFAERVGADAALQVAPYYNKPTQQGFYEHFKVLAEETGLPQCIYNIPGRTGKNIEPETIIRLAELENIAIVKEATGSLDQASQIITSTNLTVLSGDDSLTLPLMAIGGRGVISVVGNIVPQDMLALTGAMDRATSTKPGDGTANCSRCAATCSASPRIRSPSRPR